MCDSSDRLQTANQIIRIIAKFGRRFFYANGKNATSEFRLDGNRLLFADAQTGKIIDTTLYPKDWDGFSAGADMLKLADDLACYIRAGYPIDPKHFGPWPKTMNGGDPWGYGVAALDEVLRLIRLTHAVNLPSKEDVGTPPAPVVTAEASRVYL